MYNITGRWFCGTWSLISDQYESTNQPNQPNYTGHWPTGPPLLIFAGMTDRVKSWLIYAGKVAAGAISVFTLSSYFQYADVGWCLISVMLVLSPDGKDSLTLAVTRIKANLVGAGVGVGFLLIAVPNMWLIAASLVVTLGICYLLKLDAGIRSALAATIIIMMHETGKHFWDTAFQRIIAVLAGCVLGLIITFVFHFKIKPEEKPVTTEQEG